MASATIALNAYIFGYGGHSLVTPHTALKQLWWTHERIEQKVTRSFVVSKLRGEERQFLDRPLAFGEGLTDDTYMEWILDRARRLFLILTEIGVPDQIFGCIDDSWDDDDLPLPFDSVASLELAYDDDETLNHRFHNAQFVYMLREVQPGTHIDYGPKEHIPMEYVNTLPPAVSLQSWDRIHFPGRPEEIYMRRRYILVDKENDCSYFQSLMNDVQTAQTLRHEHVASIWASYTSDDAGYILSDFVAEHTLSTYIDHRTPMQLMRVPATERPSMILEWLHCLADALASLHHRGSAHAAIRPSNIIIDHDNHIAFADVGTLRTFQRGKKPYKTETYDYAAPESQICQAPIVCPSSPPASSMSAFNKLRKMSSSGSSSSASSSTTNSSTRSNSMCATTPATPVTPPSPRRSNSLKTIVSAMSPSPGPRPSLSSSMRNFSRHLQDPPCPSPGLPTLPMSPDYITPVTILPRPTAIDYNALRDLPEATPEMSDVYSLACVFLDLITFILRGKTTDFIRFRATRMQATSGRQKFRIDHSFHCNPYQIEAWMALLKDDSRKQASENPVFRGIPALLDMLKRMMMQNAQLRPIAREVRDRIQDILVDQCGIEHLCCAGREWNLPMPEVPGGASSGDSFSIRAGSLASPPRKLGQESRLRRDVGDQMSVISRVESRASASPAKVESRRTSGGSVATATITSWRRAFSRSR
ncbi:hypothetical protein LTR78_006879 [Recurvomyces mirabilis]|uniref:Protein kinase domain-containing protein n=1 Tax=Recurvomyces mirabilis TaxID=574656 RepID=A0AAE0WKD4_9PEZI|nr:hypothetical protein LTR78_006879 [Recurvomyces mirabilis]KAK5153131.1 hypothetical protein LTS14_007775 [Recurvomyces mirabilis]